MTLRTPRWLLAATVAVALAGYLALAGAAGGADPKPPDLDARAWALVDADDGELLADHASARSVAIASATKLMTAYVALEELKPEQRIRAPGYQGAPAEVVLGLSAGEKIAVGDLLYAMLLPSANDAAVTIAEGVSGSTSAFVKEMNRAARKLGLDDTRFANPIGLDAPGNRSSARDLVALTLELRKEPRFRKIVDTPEATLETGAEPRTVTTRNALLRTVPWIDGVKTGHTTEAGYVLVASGTRKDVTLVSVVLGAASESARDAETLKLLDYGFSLYSASMPVPKGRELADPEVRYGDEPLPLVAKRPIEVSARDGQRVETLVDAPGEVEGPISDGERLGRVAVTVDGESSGATPLVATRSVAAPSTIDKLGSFLPLPMIALGAIVIVIGVAGARWRTASQRSRDRSAEERRRHHEERIRRRERER